MDEQNFTTEEWRSVVGWEGVYSVSNYGRVRREFNGARPNNPPRIMKPTVNHKGYLWVQLQDRANLRKKILFVHVLVAEAFICLRPDQKWVNHKDGVKANNAVGNLEWATRVENQQHAVRTGLHPTGENHPRRRNPAAWATVAWPTSKPSMRGEKNHLAKFTDEQARQIKDEYRSGVATQSEIARRFGVTKGAIRHMCIGITWKHIP
jgi:hypothetical protein